MLIKEFMLDPEAIYNPNALKSIVSQVGVDKGRLISRPSKAWFADLKEAVKKVSVELAKVNQNSAKDAEILLSSIDSWKTNKTILVNPTREAKAGEISLCDYFTSHIDNLDGFVTPSCSLDKCFSTDDFWRDQNWEVRHNKNIEISKAGLEPYIKKLCGLSKKLYFIDPYFRLEQSGYWPIWELMRDLSYEYPHIEEVFFITSDAYPPKKVIDISKKVVEYDFGCHCEVRQFSKGNIVFGDHDRFLLSDIGVGYVFTNSFEEKADQKMDISRLEIDSFDTKRIQYIESLSSFDLLFSS